MHAIVIPAYTEAATLRDLAVRVLKISDCVIVVDDGSTDDTAKVVQDLPLVLLRHGENQGKAASLWRGMQHALQLGAAAIVTLDGDGQHAPEDIPRLIEAARLGYASLPVEIPAVYRPGARASHYRHCDSWRISRMVAWRLLSRGFYLPGLYRAFFRRA